MEGTRGDPDMSRAGHKNGAVIGHNNIPHIICLSTETRNQDWGRITVFPSMVNGMELGDQDWDVTLFLRYDIEPPYIPAHYDG